jgi:hypothetical protein
MLYRMGVRRRFVGGVALVKPEQLSLAVVKADATVGIGTA